MSYETTVLCDSIANGVRLTTLQVNMPRFILAEFNTHRMLSRNSASSRAIPVEKRIAAVTSDPFVPEAFQANQRGMQAGDALDPIAQEHARHIWLRAAAQAAARAKELADVGVHKQWANRLIEPYAWHTVICTATEWENFFNLRIHPAAQPEIQVVAKTMKDAMDASTPVLRMPGEWHTPFITDEDIEEACYNPACTVDEVFLAKLSVARCARVSYLTHDTNKRDTAADVALHDKLLTSGHMSPFEHVACVVDEPGEFCGNFRKPWIQYRKMLPGEEVFKG